jgi:glutamate-1-semialdehyde 2,1-aminomutase
VTDWASASKSDTKAFSRYFSHMLSAGYLIAPSQYECLFLSAAHTKEDIAAFVNAAADALSEL